MESQHFYRADCVVHVSGLRDQEVRPLRIRTIVFNLNGVSRRKVYRNFVKPYWLAFLLNQQSQFAGRRERIQPNGDVVIIEYQPRKSHLNALNVPNVSNFWILILAHVFQQFIRCETIEQQPACALTTHAASLDQVCLPKPPEGTAVRQAL